MGLPSGVLWSPVNIDTSRPGGFAENAFKYKCSFFSWGNTDAHNPNSRNMFDYNWGYVNDNEPYYEGQPYGSTPGAALNGDIPLTSDAAREICGGSWRIPTSTECAELFDNCDFVQADGSTVIGPDVTNKMVTVNGVVGVYIKSRINGNLLFFACCGYGSGTGWINRGTVGKLWANTYMDSKDCKAITIYDGGVASQSNSRRFWGCPIRPVMDTIG